MMQPSKTFNRLAIKLLSSLLVVAIILSVIPAQQVLAACKFKHKVQPGETLIYIADLYQTDWREIAEANDLKEPYILTIGQVLCIPNGTKPVPTTTTTTSTGTTTTIKEPTLTVGSGPNSVYVRLELFAKDTVYHIRIVPLGGNPGLVNPGAPLPPAGVVEYRVARIKTDKKGNFEDWLRIPGYVPETRWMLLCVKNVWTDAVVCVVYEHPWWSLWVDLPLDKFGR